MKQWVIWKNPMKIVQKHTEHVWRRCHVWRRRHTCSTPSPAALFIHVVCVMLSSALEAAGPLADEVTALSLHHTTSEMFWIRTYGENRISNKSHCVILCCTEPTCMTQVHEPRVLHPWGWWVWAHCFHASNLPTWARSPVIKRKEGNVTEA